MTVLIVEDDPNDVDLLIRGLRQAGFLGKLVTARDAVEAFNYFAGRAPFADRSEYPLPDLVLLDLSLPGVSGAEILASMKADLDLAKIPVFVLTGTPFRAAVDEAYKLGAKSFLFKPLDVHQISALAGALQG